MAGDGKTDVLYYSEIESYIDNLQSFSLNQIGTLKWFSQHEMLEKLNLQALHEAKEHREEVVLERFQFFDKTILLVEILISQSVWSEKVFPHVTSQMRKTTQAFPTYMVIFHTVTVASLLETLTFREPFCQTLEDCTSDLIDWCHSCIGDQIVRRDEEAFTKRVIKRRTQGASPTDENVAALKSQKEDINVVLSAKAVGILGHLIQHASVLSLSAITRMVDHHDIPILLAGLLHSNPWTIRDGKQTFKFVNGEWRLMDPEDCFILTHTEGQLWIALHQILLHPELIRKYYLNEFRKNRLMRIQSLLNEALIDQLPALADLQRYLHTLTFMQTPMPKKGLIIEQTPLIRERLLRSGNEDKWRELARIHVQSMLSDDGMLKNIAQRMASVYTADNMDNVLPDKAKCAHCGHPAKQRCSGCKMEWYCRRQCQVQQWPKHKNICVQMSVLTDSST